MNLYKEDQHNVDHLIGDDHMSRFLGIKNNRIHIISDKYFSSNDMKIIPLPSELESISSEELFINCYVDKNNNLKCKLLKKPVKELKIAFVSNFRMQCGISTYFENLAPEIVEHVKDFKLFIENNEQPTGDIFKLGNKALSSDQVSICWERGKSLNLLAEKIKEYDPDLILINHEWGLFPDAKYWLSFITQLNNYKIITILHSVFPHHMDKIIVEASIEHAVVHLEGGKKALLDKGIKSKISVIPHGCYPLSNNKLWNFYKSEHTLIQIGFGFKYKNFEDSIIAVSLLKEKYPDIFLTAIFSESSSNKVAHQLYYNELINLIDSLNLKDNVSIIRGFQSDTVINAYLKTNKIAIFPYKSEKNHEVFGSSGSARLAMTASIPVITSNMPHFSDLPTIKANTPAEIADNLDKLYSNIHLKNEQIQRQNKYIQENSWKEIALRYIELF